MDPLTRLLVVSLCLYIIGELMWWQAMEPPESLREVLSDGFPTNGFELGYVKRLARKLRKMLDNDEKHVFYVKYAYAGTYMRRQFYGLSNGVFYMNLIAGYLFGTLGGIAVTTFLVTTGCLVSLISAQYTTVFLLWLCNVDLSMDLDKSTLSQLITSLSKSRGSKRSVASVDSKSCPKATVGQAQNEAKQVKLEVQQVEENGDGNAPNTEEDIFSWPWLNDVIASTYRTAHKLKIDLDDRILIMNNLATHSPQSYSIVHLLLRMAPVLPSWIITQFLAFFPVRYSQFAMAVALGYLPYNYYSVSIGTQLESLEDHPSQWCFQLSFTLLVAVLLAAIIGYFYTLHMLREIAGLVHSTSLVPN